MPTSQSFSVNKLNQRGVIHFLLPLILVLGLVAGVYLVTSGNPLKLFSKASMSKTVPPETSLSLVGPEGCNLGWLCFIKPDPEPGKANRLIQVDEDVKIEKKAKNQIEVKLMARSDLEKANLFTAKMTFPKDLVEVSEIKTDGSFVTNWVENYYDNDKGEISLTGGVPSPGLQTQQGGESILMATIVFSTKSKEKGVISFTDSSAIYSNLNNINILTIKRAYDISTEVNPSPTSSFASRVDIPKADLDVSYIERTPRYYRYCVNYSDNKPGLCPGTEKQKMWPEQGETVTYTAHIINKGQQTVPNFNYQWLVNDSVAATGNLSGPEYSKEVTVSYQTTWSNSPQKIQFKVNLQNKIDEESKANNSLTIGSHDLTISIWVEKGLYDIFNKTPNLVGTYSFEDWIQAQFFKMNQRFSEAVYPTSPDGILDRVRIDKIVVADNLDGRGNPMDSDLDKDLIDGRWQFRDNDQTNKTGQNGGWQQYVNSNINTIDWGLIHELGHQLGLIDLYRMNLANDPQNNNRVHVMDVDNKEIPYTSLPQTFSHPGIYAGGDTMPYNDGTYFESISAAGLNSNIGKRRGFYGEYLFDTPNNTYLRITNANGGPVIDAQVFLYQKDPASEIIDNMPEITGRTDTKGRLLLPNRPVAGTTTATGHTLKANPFGQINVVGTNGTMLVRVVKDSNEAYGFVFITDLNLAYYSGNKDTSVINIKTNLPTSSIINTKGDGNKDGKVNLVDLSVMLTDWLKNKEMKDFRDGVDMNNDGLINTFDFGLLRNLFVELKVIRVSGG